MYIQILFKFLSSQNSIWFLHCSSDDFSILNPTIFSILRCRHINLLLIVRNIIIHHDNNVLVRYSMIVQDVVSMADVSLIQIKSYNIRPK